MKIIRNFTGASNPDNVKLVEIDGKKWVYKKENAKWVYTEKVFNNILKDNKLPYLQSLDVTGLKADEILLEYVEGELTMDCVYSTKNYEQFGKIIRTLHSIQKTYSLTYHEDGTEKKLDWKKYMKSYMDEAIKRADKNKNYDLNSKILSSIKKESSKLLDYEPKAFSLIHGDLHLNNILVKDNNLILFDKNDEVFFGSHYMDLAILALDLCNGTFINVDDPDYEHDKKLLDAFMRGYGRTFDAEEPIFLRFVILIAFRRLNSPFQKYNKEIIFSCLQKLETN